MTAKKFSAGDTENYYLDKDKWLAVDPEEHKYGKAASTFPFPTGKYDVTLRAVAESDGQSTYKVSIDDEALGDFKCPLSKNMFEEGPAFYKTWPSVSISDTTAPSVILTLGHVL